MNRRQRLGFAAAIIGLALLPAGCGTPGSTQPATGGDIARSVLGGFSLGGINVGAAASAATHAADAYRDIPESEEIAMGKDIAAGLLGAAPLVRSSQQEIYVNNLGRWLALHSSRPDLPWHFGILDTDTVNAFATPGGNVFVSRGLLLRVHSESELAGVLAHEISHVALKHHLADIQKNAQKNLALDLASVKSGGLAGEAARAVARVGLESYVRGLSRDDELAADRMGVVIAARAGYEPYGLVAVLQSLEALPEQEAGQSLLLKTHPSPADRIAALQAAMPPVFETYAAPNPALARYNKVFPMRK